MIGSNFVLILGAVCIVVSIALNIYITIEDKKKNKKAH